MTVMPISNLAMIARIDALSNRAQAWMLEEAFPFWAERAPSSGGGFVERLDLAGSPIAGEPSRVRLQARMVFSFALAAQLGWDRAKCRDLVEHGLDCLTADCRRNDGLFGKIVVPGKGLLDDTAETYDNAFALLAFASASQTFGIEPARQSGTELNAAMDALLRRPQSEGGYAERLPAPVLRSQNPHMHLTEASLAWFAATGDEASLHRAQKTAQFVIDRFFDPNLAMLLEHDGGPSPDNRMEAGHMFEWVWILGELARATGASQRANMAAFHAGGMKLLSGLDYVPLSHDCDGSVREPLQRTWGLSEKLKAHIALWRVAPSRELLTHIADTAEQVFADHVDPAIPGAWVDRIAPDRTPLVEDITPATGYHIFLAFKELIDLAGELKL